MEPNFDRNFIIRMAQYTKREYNTAIIEAETIAYRKAKVDAEARYDMEYWKKESDRNAKHAEEYEAKFKAFEKTLGLEYIITENKDKEELIKIGNILKTIIDLNYRLKRDGEIKWFEDDLKRLERDITNVREAVHSLGKGELKIDALNQKTIVEE